MKRQRRSVAATMVDSSAAVVGGAPGSYYLPEDRSYIHLRCPCGRCDKHNALPLIAGRGGYVWRLSGQPGKHSLSPSIHWFEPDGRKTHWHGHLRDGCFEG
jgi:hypothetical protein